MAEVDRYVAGLKFEEFIAHEDGVQRALAKHTDKVAARARVLLAEHHHDGDAEIDTQTGDIDHYVVLSDERGQHAALSIEFGREAYEREDGTEVGAMEGLHILGRAAKLKAK